MNIRKAIGDLFLPRRGAVSASVGTSYGPASRQIVDNLLIETMARECATVYTCADLIRKAIGNIDFKAADPYWNDTLNNPNLYQTKIEFIRDVAWSCSVHGNAYIKRNPGKRAQRGTLACLSPVSIEPQGTSIRPAFRVTGEDKIFTSSEIIHVRSGGGLDLKAISPVEAGWKVINALQFCNCEILNVFKNGINMSHVLHGGNADQDTLMKMLLAVKEAYGVGGESRAGVVGLTGGFKLDTIKGITPADSDLRNLRVDLIREVAALFGVPPFAAGGSSDTKFSNVVARNAQVAKEALLPLALCIRNALSKGLMTDIDFDEEDLIKGDFGTAIEMAIKASGGPVETPNESRARYMGLDAVEGGDELRNKMPDPRQAEPEDDRRGELPTDGSGSDR